MLNLLVDLDLCVACHACEISCKQEHNLPDGVTRVKLVQLGPKRINEKLCSDYLPVMNDKCDICVHRVKAGMKPACVENCPTDALFLTDENQTLKHLKSGKRINICKVTQG